MREVINVVVLCGRLLMLWCCAGGYVVVLCGNCCGVVREVKVVVLCGRLLLLWCWAGG